MTLKYAAGRAVLDQIRKSTTNDLLICDRSNAPVLKSLYDSGAIKEKDLIPALEKAVFNEAHQAVKIMRRQNPSYRIPVDLSCNPKYLVYSIEHGVLNEEELGFIKSRLGGNGKLEEFVKENSQSNVLESLRERLLNPQPLVFSGSGDHDGDIEHPACSCGH
jgi:hypothetical protein